MRYLCVEYIVLAVQGQYCNPPYLSDDTITDLISPQADEKQMVQLLVIVQLCIVWFNSIEIHILKACLLCHCSLQLIPMFVFDRSSEEHLDEMKSNASTILSAGPNFGGSLDRRDRPLYTTIMGPSQTRFAFFLVSQNQHSHSHFRQLHHLNLADMGTLETPALC